MAEIGKAAGVSGEYDESTDSSQRTELHGPDNAGLYTSQLHDWIPLCPELRDSAVRLYWIMRALVIEKHGPVRKLTLLQLCYLLPAKPVKPGEKVKPSSLARIRSLLAELSAVGLISTPEGGPIKTSSRAGASAAPLRIRINDRPRRGYPGPRNAFALLDAVRAPAAEAADRAIRAERKRAEQKRAERTATDAGQISSPGGAGQKSSPLGQKSSPHSHADLQDRESPLSPPAQSSRSHPMSVHPSVSVGEEAPGNDGSGTDGGMDAGGVIEVQEERPGAAGGVGAAAAGAAPQAAAAEGVPPQREAVPVAQTPGVELLLSIGASRPELLLTGAALRDQGAVVTELLARGWRREVLREVITGRPLPVPLTKSVGAVIAARLREAAAMPVPRLIGGPAAGAAGADGDVEPSSTAAADRTAEDALRGVPVMAECEGRDGTCGRPLAAGRDRCPECLGWPECTADGCTRRVQGGGLCPQCWDAALSAPEPTEDGTCPGHDGTGCGRAAVSGGLCARCKVAAAEALARAIEAAKAAVAAEEEATATP